MFVSGERLNNCYEELRANAGVGCFCVAPDGLAVILDKGLPGWMYVWSHIHTDDTFPAVRSKTGCTVQPSGSDSDIAVVLAGMAIEASKES